MVLTLGLLVDILFLVALFVTILVYLFYPIVLFIISLFSSRRKFDVNSSLPELSVIVPTYNEVHVIESKLVALLKMSYPRDRYEIIVVDSASSDGTTEIVRKFEKQGVVLLGQEKRMGKCNAINFALEKAKGEIVVLSDANSTFSPDTFQKLVQRFGDGVGGVQPRICPYNNDNIWDSFFLWLHHVFKTLESNVDSVFFASGKLLAFRRTSIAKIDDNAAADDLEIALNIRRRKLKITYAPEIKVVEKTPTTQTEARVQRVRRAFGVLQAMQRHMIILFNPNYGAYGLIIFPTHFLQMTLQPFLIFYLLAVAFVKILLIIPSANTVGSFLIVTFACVVFVSLSVVKKVRRTFSVIYNFLLTQIYIILAIFDLLRGKSYHIWEKASSTRDSPE